LRWWQFDLAGYVIRLLERLRLAHDVYRVAPATLAARYARSVVARNAPSETERTETAAAIREESVAS
jgi:hypothetical protein